ncbi:MAG: hypothetical protein KY468_16780 [Armatimonadetes bacterium]|nr:hypothetical protein [Armatimonadota bacterium]
MSMNEAMQKLHDLHRIDERIHRVQKNLAALEEPPPLTAQLKKVIAELERQEAMLQKAQVNLREAELNLKSLEAKREQDRQKLYSGKMVGTRELQALEREIENLGNAVSAAEERVLEAMEQIEPLQANVGKLKEYQANGEAKLDSLQREREQARKKLQADLAEARPLRDPAAQAVEPGLLNTYEKIRARLGHPGLSVVTGGACGFCHTSLPSFVMRELQEGKVLQCDSCSRIYYLPEAESTE